MSALPIAQPDYTEGLPDTLRVVEVDPHADRRWEAFVTAHPEGLVYHHPAWLRVLEQAYHYRPLYLACEHADGQVAGILPLFLKQGLVTGRVLSSLPHTPVAGPLSVDERVTAALVRAAIARVRSAGNTRLQLKMPSPELDGLVDGLTGRPWEATYVLDLPERPDQLRFGNSRNHGRIKWAINKAAREGVQVRAAETVRDLRAWYGLYLDAMREHAVPPRPYRFFAALWAHLRPHGLLRLLLAEQRGAAGGRLLAGSLFLLCNQTVFYAFNGRRREDLALRPNDVIQWQAIHDACRDGFHRYDFGEVPEGNASLAEFKRKWGAHAGRIYRYHYPAPRELEAGTFRSGGHPRRVVNSAWRRLPLPVTALLGDSLYRYL